MKENKAVLITIIVLLCIFLPLSVFGLIKNKEESIKESKLVNPNHELYYKGDVWFYDNEKLLATYKCTTDDCELAQTNNNDNEYNINYYKDGTDNLIKPYNNKYAFIQDGDDIFLFDISTKTVLTKYSNVKNYGTNIEGSRLLIENGQGKWGVLAFGSVLENVIPFDYDFVGLPNKLTSDNALESSNFIVEKDSKWYIVNDKNEPLCPELEDTVVDFNDNYIITLNNSKYSIFNYTKEKYFESQEINDYAILNNYVAILVTDKLFIYDNPHGVYIGNVDIKSTYKTIELELNNSKLDVLLDETVVNSIEIN